MHALLVLDDQPAPVLHLSTPPLCTGADSSCGAPSYSSTLGSAPTVSSDVPIAIDKSRRPLAHFTQFTVSAFSVHRHQVRQ